MAENYCIITFYSIHLALKFEKVVKEKGIETKLMPVPRQISSSCGTAGIFNEGQIEEIKKICKENDIEFEHIYRIYQDRTKKPEEIS